MIRSTSNSHSRIKIDPQLIRRAIALTLPNRPGTIPLPGYIGRPGMVLMSDSHGEIESVLSISAALPSSIRFAIDLGDKVDHGPDPIGTNFVLQTMRIKRVLGNHDGMWIDAGLGIPSQSIELIRWLMRYNEIKFLTSDLGIILNPLKDYAEKYFPAGSHRIETKSKESPVMEAAATYLKIIAEAPIRFPEHAGTRLNESDLRVRRALFFKSGFDALRGPEKEIFGRLTGPERLLKADSDYFYRLIGGLKTFTEEEQTVMDHCASEFRNNEVFYDFVRWMVGEGDIHLTFRPYQGYPCGIIATHATIPLDENGDFKPFFGKTGRAVMLEIKERIQIAMEAWRHVVQHGDTTMMELHQEKINSLAYLPWTAGSPIYGRQMQTAARAVLPESSGTWEEPKEPFFTHFEKYTEPQDTDKTRRLIAGSFGIPDHNNFVIVRGHEPSKDGSFQVLAGGFVINIDGGLAAKYGRKGGALVFGDRGAAWLSYPGLEYSRVPLPMERH
ncbi:MAG: fructose-bisphosphatase class III [Candidatus Saganbacteria bacterium]|nr:fructose-bisphosphatase class III [Candidatus Saganbacteria bacterium]